MTTKLENPKSHVERGYDIVADQYLAWTSPRQTPVRTGLVTDLLKNLPAGADVLELGCGAGVPCTQVLVDHGLIATLIHGDMLTLDFAQASFDAVLAFYSIFHLPKEEQVLMIAKIKGWLKPGGWVLCNFQEDAGDMTYEGWFNFKPSITMFSSGLGVEGTRDLLNKQGFKLAVDEVMIDEVDIETVGQAEERFHWVMAQKGDVHD
ncbi:S-adenosyl-L-methionine-dependent methyltransferase [Mycena rosella]|uniref:S-adenosyl-L-methionine-dependent methyltransferase n=1 Tax=Mycena rosella TaxID=1033263 RepID=A0AAD7DHL5_MYCRO|nr:S-adenosyl-L-methionine-dependent methyltransferase [Mycena rosella]